ncbi:sarcosine oxidase [Polychaeton citri CBS 116435]|uniref:Sarcosine oxidase n=1 Tax=Polychaeton citri CBS 116435 TaxID=1314669 RepID=A0A9P4Q5Y0_9PEZI|nr:sarcosine oxidase [Polychaeton citri CBS 116435]
MTMANPSIIIVGGGAFGTSTAYHLAHQGYTRVTVLDRFAAPSKDAAATDLNKIIRADYPNPLLSKLGQEAMSVWKDPKTFLSGLYRPTGWIMAAHEMTQGFLRQALQTAVEDGRKDVRLISINETKRRWPEFTGTFSGWTNLWSPGAGWVPSGQALLRMATAAQASGAQYITGNAGWVKKLLYDDKGACIGVIAADGTTYLADVVVICTGANTAALIDAKDEIVARSHCVGVIKLTIEEVQKYQNLPIVDDFEQGILFPPDDNGLLKLCSCRFITNYYNSSVPGASLGHSHEDFPGDGVPRQIEEEMRDFVRDMLPELADREWASTRMCWDGDTKDVNFRVCPMPNAKNLFVATAGSGHGFKFMPIIGKYVVAMLEGNLDPEYAELWKWRFGATPPKTGVEPHPWPQRDLGELDGWKGRNKRAIAPSAAASILPKL